MRNSKNQTRSALHLAAESGNADICEMLLSKNAYVNRCDEGLEYKLRLDLSGLI